MTRAPGCGILCPLTGSADVEFLQQVPVRLLIDRYRRDFGIDVGATFDGVDTIALCESRVTGLQFFSPAVTGDADMYAGLRGQGWYDPADKFEFGIGAAEVRPADRVLDVGCGTGHFAGHIPDAEYLGHDMEAATPGGVTLSGDLGDLAREHGDTFDVVTAFQVLEHTADPAAFVRDCLALLKPGGRLVIGVPDRDSYLGSLRNFVLNAPPHHVTLWNALALNALAELTRIEDPVLHVAPVEGWETRLYWMARVQCRLTPPSGTMFEGARRGRVTTVVSYLLAGLADRFLTPDSGARGATTVLVGRKQSPVA